MKIRTLTYFGYTWLIAAGGLIVIGILGMIVTSDSLGEAWEKITTIFNPLNFINTVLIIFMLSPGLFALNWAENSGDHHKTSRRKEFVRSLILLALTVSVVALIAAILALPNKP